MFIDGFRGMALGVAIVSSVVTIFSVPLSRCYVDVTHVPCVLAMTSNIESLLEDETRLFLTPLLGANTTDITYH